MPSDTNYRFVPTVRRGYRPTKTFEDTNLDSDPMELPAEAETTVDYDAAVTEGPDEGTGDGQHSGSVDLSMYGPAHVTGIESGQVVRVEPAPGSSTTPPNYFPFVEFETPDLPWLFSPVQADSDGRSFPWLMLVAVPKSKASVEAAGGRPNPVLDSEADSLTLGPVGNAWAWAHAQVTGDTSGDLTETFTSRSDATVSRLICPRNLEPSTAYVAAVVPTFEAGRKVGLGEDPPSGGDSNGSTFELAWGSDGTFQDPLPAYHHWEFETSEKGDFEFLVRKLEPEDLTSGDYGIGYREMDVTDPGPESLDYEDGSTHTVKLGGALQASECDDWWWYDRSDELRQLLNDPAGSIGVDPTEYPVVGPPVYGQWHSQEIFERSSQTGGFLDLTTGPGFDWSSVSTDGMNWCDSDVSSGTVPSSVTGYDGYGPLKPKLGTNYHAEEDLQWLYDVNLTPSFRIPASVGAGIVQDQQENLMKAAWDQVGDVREANRRLGAAQLSAGAMRPAVERLESGDYPTERLLQVTEPAHERMYLDDYETTAADHLAESRLREGVLSPSFRRLTSPAGRLSQRMSGDASGEGVVSGLLDGSLDTSIDARPDGIVHAEAPRVGFDDVCDDIRTVGERQADGVPWREPSPEQRDRQESRTADRTEEDEGGASQPDSGSNPGSVQHPGQHSDSFQKPADMAHDRLWKMRRETEEILGKLEKVRTLVSDHAPTQSTVTEVRREANDAVGLWHTLDTKVGNFQGLIASVSNKRQTLPNVADSFDTQTRKQLYSEMSAPFDEPFLPSVSNNLVWPGGLRSFSGGALDQTLDLTTLPPETYEMSTYGSATGLGSGTGDQSDSETEGGDDENREQSTDGGTPGGSGSGGGGGGGSGGGGQQTGGTGDESGPTYPVSLAEVSTAQDSVRTVQGAIDDVLGYFGEGGSDVAYLVRLFCQRSYKYPDPDPEPDAAAVTESWSPLDSFVDRTHERLGAPGLRRRADPLDTIMAYPEFDQPMYRDLKNVSEQYILPGAEEVPADSVGALRTNRRFIEAFMIGLNHEMGSELLWRNYPSDRRGSYFKRFWDQRSRVPKPEDDDKLDDVIPLHRWDDKGGNNRGPSPLGSNIRTGEPDSAAVADEATPPDDRSFGTNGPDPDEISPTVVLLIRGELLRRYPNTAIYAAKAHHKDGDREPKWATSSTKSSEKDTDYVKFPIFRGKLDPDITFFGFDLTTKEAVGTTETTTVDDKTATDDLGWFFVLSEPPGETKFGLDIGQEGETEVPYGIAEGQNSDPVRKAEEDDVEEGVERGWAGLSWKHLPTGSDGSAPQHVDVDDHRPGGSDPWTVEDGTVWAKEETWKVDGDESVDQDIEDNYTFGPDDAATWGKNSAHMAFITWQKPVRIAIHADDILAGGGA